MPIPLGYSETIVTPKASSNVEACWSFHASTRGQSLILPDGRCDVILRFNADAVNSVTPVVTGPATRPYIVEFEAGDCWIGVRLCPANAAAVWKQRIGSASDAVLSGDEAVTLLPPLAHLSSQRLSKRNLAQMLEQQFSCAADRRLSHALNTLHATGGRIRIKELATYAACTSRQLGRLFHTHVGLSAKIYAQIVQFHRTLTLLQNRPISIAAAAFEGGYADQAHLSRAFQRFGGFTPSTIPKDLSIPTLFA